MPIFRRFLHKGGATAIWQTSESVDELHALFLKSPTADAPAYATLASDKRRKEWLAERLLLRCAFLRCDDIGHRADGSPYLTAGGAHVSISHSGRFVALSLSAAARIGIDLEQRGPRAFRLREKFLSPGEYGYDEPEDAETAALTAWSAKEAAFKLFGRPGISLKNGIRLTHAAGYGASVDIEAELCDGTARAIVNCRLFEQFVFTRATFLPDVT